MRQKEPPDLSNLVEVPLEPKSESPLKSSCTIVLPGIFSGILSINYGVREHQKKINYSVPQL